VNSSVETKKRKKKEDKKAKNNYFPNFNYTARNALMVTHHILEQELKYECKIKIRKERCLEAEKLPQSSWTSHLNQNHWP
jgi:hypothetical protein